MREKNLREIDGKKIRRQYFTLPVILLFAAMLFIPYCILIFTIQLDKFSMQEWLESLLMSVYLCLFFGFPWIALKIFNRFCFGEIICVLNENGIYHKDGFIEWKGISKIEYIIDLPSRYRYDPKRKCRAIVHTESKSIVLLCAPSYLLRSAKKYAPQIKTGLSSSSKRLIAFLVILTIVLVPAVPLISKVA